ncbi:S9 family peptidase [Siphonobacter sp. BAB-5385]|uniref:S9 family peptidase n=1 Tax=Siphonobacter sp. BAB-5385 TaxID=1864822 RepID=UPI000B9E98E2|nr:prolyl oligopeptidase family serine peptidase [Siphonobacter sp. BAB-5385]OZI08425.1 S9 family peptidase [Siphonobacter sp. BAB-5385]
MKRCLLLGLLLGLYLPGWTQSKTKPPITWKDVTNWKAISNFGGTQLSPDGQWMAYVLSSVAEGDAELVLQKTTDSTQYRYPIGSVIFVPMSYSDDSRFFAFKVFPTAKEKKAAGKTPGKPLPEKVFLIELANRKKTEFERVSSFAFNGEKASHLALLLSPATPAMAPTAPKGRDLLLYELTSGKTQNIGNVADMSFNKKGDWLALTIDANEKAGNGLHLRNMTTGLTSIIDNDKARYQSLTWTEKGDGLAALKGTQNDKYKTDVLSVLGVKLRGTTPELTVYDPGKDSLNFPKKMKISPNRRPTWTEDLSRLLFGIQKEDLAKKEAEAKEAKKDTVQKPKPSPVSEAQKLAKIKADTTIKSIEDLQKALAKVKTDSARVAQRGGTVPSSGKDDIDKPEVTIWNWQDKRLQSRQQVTEMQDKQFSFLAMYDGKKFTRLTDSTLMTVRPAAKDLYAVGLEDQTYELETSLDGQNYADIYVVDLKTGAKTKVLEKLYLPSYASSPMTSEDGTKFTYGKDGHFYVYDIPSKTSLNLTEKLPTSFVDTEDDHNQKKPMVPMLGWSTDSKYVLLRDVWDIWKVSVDGKEAVNLTKNGRKEKIHYTTRYKLDPEEKGINLKQPLYVRMYGEFTKKSGIGRIEVDKKGNLVTGVKPLLWEDASVSNLSKAKKANVYVFSRETFTKPTDYFVSTSPELTSGKQVTKNTPEFEKYAWSSGVRLVDYVSDKGDTLQGALFLPAGYETGKKYPTIVYYYEKLSQTLHAYTNPGYSGTGWNPNVYTSNGYAVFIPDIVYKMNDPGMSAVWCVLPAVKAALKTGVIDETKMGIHGHSWGGYQTSFLITQTNLFKAAAAGAPLTDMVSMYNLIYKNSGTSNGQIFEGSQGRLVAPWENWDAYYRNSPLHHVKNIQTPLLLLHNDADGAVDFTQGIEYYTALRRLKKPVVLFQYKGENHGLAKLPNRKDYAMRMMEFFDYHLKNKPAPDWWSKGIERSQLEEHLEKRILFDN